MPSSAVAAQLRLDSERKRKRDLSSLWTLCTEYLGYDKLSESFHKPMLADWDRIDRGRFAGKNLNTLDLWPRDHIKTWCERARIIRAYAMDPTITVTWWHAVEEMAQESGVAIGKTLQSNKDLRRLFPQGVLPSPMAKRFVSATGFSLNSNRTGDAPSFRAWGAGSEATGGHSRIGVLDDPVGYNDVVDSQMPAKRRWYQATACNVVRADGWMDSTATRWDKEDLSALFLASKNWVCRIRACLETDGAPDYDGEPVYLTKQQVKKKREELGPVQFAMQMMNDVSRSEERPWVPANCEHYCTLEEAKGQGFVCVIMDPAARNVGDEDYLMERKRADGTKNFWAIQVWKVRRRGMRQERIWLDGASSQDWTMDEGMITACRLQRKWHAAHVFIEDIEPFHYLAAYKKVARTEAVRARPELLRSRIGGKNPRWGAFCGRADSEEILICKESVPDRQVEKFLRQAREWVPRGRSNGLPMDDEADCASYVMDPAIDEFAPRVSIEEEESEWSPYRTQKKEDGYGYRSRHISY